ncbi:MAG: hypothetical protein ACI9R3_005096 [Verrucomicrobiales bacterium]|jgi:hypothetical protein
MSKNDDIVELRVASRLYRIDEISNANIYITAGITEGGKSHPYVIEEKQGHLAVDWETAVAYNPMTRDELLTHRPSAPTSFRVYLGQTDRYFEPFSVEAYQAVQLIFPDKIETVDAFISRENVGLIYVAELLKTQHLAPVILKLRIPEDFEGDAVLIDSFVQPRWFVSE